MATLAGQMEATTRNVSNEGFTFPLTAASGNLNRECLKVVPQCSRARRICGSCGVTAQVDWVATCGSCGGHLKHRRDDNEAVVLERLKVYHRQTRPIVEFYGTRPTFRSATMVPT